MTTIAIPSTKTRTAPIGGQFAARTGERIVVPMLAAGCVFAYVLRSSLPAYLYPSVLGKPLFIATIACLFAAASWTLLVGRTKLRLTMALLICCATASLMHCEDRRFAGARLIGWCLLLATVGPLNRSDVSKQLRRHAYRIVTWTAAVATVASAGWWLVGLPNLGYGGFSGVLWHSMVLGPVSALCGVLALTTAFRTQRIEWMVLYLVALLTCTLAASRSALAAMGFATMIFFALQLRRNAWISLTALTLATFLFVAPGLFIAGAMEVLPEGVTEGLAKKGWNHSREYHWQARWDEFSASPITGVGFSYGWLGTIGVNEELSTVETGSSYLAILSMTGLVGACGFALVILSFAFRFLRYGAGLPPAARMEIACLAGFWFVHLGAEGYIYAVGSLMGILFWLWLGRSLDAIDVAAFAAAPKPPICRSTTPPVRVHRHAA